MTLPELELARRAAVAGGEIVSRYFHDGVTMRSKAISDLVSDADVESEQAIADLILATYPGHAILGEETHQGDPAAEHLWVIDPLDGTTNFAHGIPHFAVSIGYYRAGEPVCGVIYNPVRNDWYTAVKGGGAFAGERQVRVAESKALSEVLVGCGFYYDRGEMMQATLSAIGDLFRQQIHGIRRFGTASLDLCQVGMGMFGAFFEYRLSPWDFAAGRLFVEEAGGKITDCQGADLPLARSTVLASNGLLHPAMLEIVSQHVPATETDS